METPAKSSESVSHGTIIICQPKSPGRVVVKKMYDKFTQLYINERNLNGDTCMLKKYRLARDTCEEFLVTKVSCVYCTVKDLVLIGVEDHLQEYKSEFPKVIRDMLQYVENGVPVKPGAFHGY